MLLKRRSSLTIPQIKENRRGIISEETGTESNRLFVPDLFDRGEDKGGRLVRKKIYSVKESVRISGGKEVAYSLG